MELTTLPSFPESDWLDFKFEWHDNLAELVIDILCLANSDADHDRYLVFGVNDKDRSQIHTPVDNRKTLEQLNDFLGKRNFTRIPNISLQTVDIGNVQIDVLTIGKSTYRPYFLTQDYKFGNVCVRAGVVYTRNGAVNTPKDSTASENQIADMWRERFGLDLSPLDRLNMYIQDTDNWKRVNNPFVDDNVFSYYYVPFPEFTIDCKNKTFPGYDSDSIGNIRHSDAFWGKTIGASADSYYVIKYLNTVLVDGMYTIMDNHRNFLIAPRCRFVWYSSKLPITEVHVETSEAFVTDTGLKNGRGLERINNDNLVCNRAPIGYHIENSFEHGLQKILDKDVYETIFFPEGEHIANRIYLIPEKENVTSFIRKKTLGLLKLGIDPNVPK